MRTSFFLLLAACSSTVVPADDGGGSSVGGNGNGGGNAQGANDGTGGSDANGGAGDGGGGIEPTVERVGNIVAYSTTYGGDPNTIGDYRFTAEFAILPSEPGVECEQTNVGSCLLTVCHNDSSSEPTAPTLVTAGHLVLSRGNKVIEADPLPDGNYEEILAAPIFSGGELLTATVEGSDDVPACSLDIVAPDAVVVVEPNLSFPLTIDRSLPLELTWEGGFSTMVYVEASTTVAMSAGISRVTSVQCGFQPGSGGGVLAPELLQHLDVDADETVLITYAGNWAPTEIGDWTMWMTALRIPMTPENNAAISFDVEIE